MIDSMFGLKCIIWLTLSIACLSVKGATLTDSAITKIGSYTLMHSLKGQKVKVSIKVRAIPKRGASKPIGNHNYLSVFDGKLNSKRIVLPVSCLPKEGLLDINYIRLDDDGKTIRFWVQGGDGSEAYQVVFYLFGGENQTVECKFLPDGNQTAIEPMMANSARSERRAQ